MVSEEALGEGEGDSSEDTGVDWTPSPPRLGSETEEVLTPTVVGSSVGDRPGSVDPRSPTKDDVFMTIWPCLADRIRGHEPFPSGRTPPPHSRAVGIPVATQVSPS